MAKKMAAAIVVLLLTFEVTFAGESRFSNSSLTFEGLKMILEYSQPL